MKDSLEYGDLVKFNQIIPNITEEAAKLLASQLLGTKIDNYSDLVLSDDQEIIIYEAKVMKQDLGFIIKCEATVISKERCKNAREAINTALSKGENYV